MKKTQAQSAHLAPFISVILPVHNDSKYLGSAITSILNQSFDNFELIVINDGSTDDSQRIIDSFKDGRIRAFSKPNSGISDSLNLGISLSRGNWVARMDSDDIAISSRFEEQVKFVNEDVAVIGTQGFLIDENSTIVGRTNFLTSQKSINSTLLNLVCPIIHPSVLINKSHLLKVGGYDGNFIVAQDYDLWLRLLKVGKVIIVDKPLILLRKHANNISKSKFEYTITEPIISLYNFYRASSANLMSLDIYNTFVNNTPLLIEKYRRRCYKFEQYKMRYKSNSLSLLVVLKLAHKYVQVLIVKKILIKKIRKDKLFTPV